MKINYIDEPTLNNLKKLIGAKIEHIYLGGGALTYGNGEIWDSGGTICLVFYKKNMHYKIRLRFYQKADGPFNLEFYEWEEAAPFKERFNTRTGVVNYDQTSDEDSSTYRVFLKLAPRTGENHDLYNQIRSVKIYHYFDDYENEDKLDFVAFIDFETETGRRIILEQDDPIDSFYLYLDSLETLNYRLDEAHDTDGPPFGEKIYQLRHQLTQ